MAGQWYKYKLYKYKNGTNFYWKENLNRYQSNFALKISIARVPLQVYKSSL